jgi:hypothetical protein
MEFTITGIDGLYSRRNRCVVNKGIGWKSGKSMILADHADLT